MAIPTKRFEFLTQETNLPLADFFTSNNTSILNSSNNDIKNISADLEGFIGNLTQNFNIEDLMSQASSLLPSRDSKDILSNLSDLTSLIPNDLTQMLTGLLPDSALALTSMNKMSSSCKKRALNKRGSGRPYSPSVSCNGTDRRATGDCDASSFSTAMNQATNGQYQSQYSNKNNDLNRIISLSSMGYDMNMCGVFGSLSTGIADNNLLSRASGSLLGKLTTDKNILGMLDLSSSSGGLHTILENPSGIVSMLSSFQYTNDFKENERSTLSDRYTGAMEIFDPNWNRSQYDLSLSTSGVKSKDMADLLQTKELDNVYDTTNINVIPQSDNTFLSMFF